MKNAKKPSSWFVSLIMFTISIPWNSNADDTISTSLFIDSYSAYAKNKLLTDERSYVTQASQNNDIHLNLLSGGIGYDDSFLRVKLVGQCGDSVDINYNAEPQDSFKFIQESYIGTYINKDTSIDIGTFLAHIGAEGWQSKDNINYTRSLIAEFSPYYETGVRLMHKFNDIWSGQVLGLNGWQNTSDNRHPALGTQLQFAEDNLIVTSNTFVGEENFGNRFFHDLIVTKNFDSGFTTTGSIDTGYQSDSGGTWWGYTLMARQALSKEVLINSRFESYQDPDGIIVTSVTGEDFRAIWRFSRSRY